MALTRRQKEVLDFLRGFVAENGYSPSYEEIGHGLNVTSLATVHKHITSLQEKGYLRRGFNQSRSIEVSADYINAERERVGHPDAPQTVPLLGRIAAGMPVESVSGNETLAFGDFTGDGDTFALEVRGDSMIGDHILSGDYVLVERTANVRDGEIVVALVDGMETTLKRFYREPGNRARLQPANAEMEPIHVELDRLQIQGRVLAVMRKYR